MTGGAEIAARLAARCVLCVTARVLHRQAAAKEKQSFHFNWPIPTTVTVVENRLEGGKKSKSRYKVQLVQDGENYRLKLTDFQFITIAGRDAKDPRYAKVLAPGKDPFVRGFVKLSAEMTLEGQEARTMLAKLMKNLSAGRASRIQFLMGGLA